MELLYDVDAWLTELLQRLGRRIFATTTIPPEIQGIVFAGLVMVIWVVSFVFYASITIVETAAAIPQESTPATSGDVTRFSAYISLVCLMLFLLVLGDKILRVIHVRLDAKKALSTDKDYGDGYEAWAGVIAVGIAVVVVMISGWISIGLLLVYVCFAYGRFVSRHKRRPRRRRARRTVTDLAAGVLERLRQQPVPQT